MNVGRLDQTLDVRPGLLALSEDNDFGLYMHSHSEDFPGGSDGKSVCLQWGRPRFDPWVGKIPWRRKWQPTPVFLPGKSHGWRSLIDYSPWGRKGSDMPERLHFLSP